MLRRLPRYTRTCSCAARATAAGGPRGSGRYSTPAPAAPPGGPVVLCSKPSAACPAHIRQSTSDTVKHSTAQYSISRSVAQHSTRTSHHLHITYDRAQPSPAHPIPSHPIPSHPIPSHPIPAHLCSATCALVKKRASSSPGRSSSLAPSSSRASISRTNAQSGVGGHGSRFRVRVWGSGAREQG